MDAEGACLDFLAAEDVFDGPIYHRLDDRRDYGEIRITTMGLLNGRMVVICWTPRGRDRHVFSMRKASAREQTRYEPSSPNRYGETDFAKVDAYVLTQADYDEIPELTDEWFEKADFYIGDKLIRRGRPKLERPKAQVTLRLDADLLEGLRATGPGWQTRVNAALREWLDRR